MKFRREGGESVEDREKLWRRIRINALVSFITSLICSILVLHFYCGII